MNRNPKRLAFFVSEDWYFHSHRLPLGLAAIDAGFEVHLIARLSSTAPLLREQGIVLHDYNIGRGALDVNNHFRHINRLTSLLNDISPTLLHNVAMKPVIYGSLAAGRAESKPWVVNALGGLGYIFTSNALRARALRLPARVALRAALRANPGTLIVQNDDDKSLVLRHRLLASSKITTIRGSGVDTAAFSPAVSDARPPVIAFVGRFLREKGVHEYLDAVGKLRSDGVDARFAMLGGGDPENPSSIDPHELRRIANRHAVELWGWRVDMASALKDVDIAVLPSYREGLPKALIEAAATGLPIVTTDAPGCRDVVTDSVNGYLVPVRSVEPLARAIKRLIVSPDLREKFGQASRERAVREFSVQDVVDRTLKVYGEGYRS